MRRGKARRAGGNSCSVRKHRESLHNVADRIGCRRILGVFDAEFALVIKAIRKNQRLIDAVRGIDFMRLFGLIALRMIFPDVKHFPVCGAEGRTARHVEVSFESNLGAVLSLEHLFRVQDKDFLCVTDVNVLPCGTETAGMAGIDASVLT